MDSVERGRNRYYTVFETIQDSDTYCFKEQIKKKSIDLKRRNSKYCAAAWKPTKLFRI